jgi:CheY-like chemotaxis protein
MDHSRRITVLLAEDDPDDQYLFRSALNYASKAADVFMVYTGKEVIEFLLSNSIAQADQALPLPDIIIADVRKPFFELEMVKEIRIYSQFRNIPIYLFSINDSALMKQKAIRLGANGFYQKPYSFHDLRLLMKEILKKSGLN